MDGVIDVDNLIYIDGLMTNYDHTIDKDKEEKIKQGGYYGGYSAWEFHGDIIFKDNRFICEIWRWGKLIDIIEAETLKEIMKKASDKWGWD